MDKAPPLKHTTLQDLLAHKDRISGAAKAGGHDAYMPVPVQIEGENGKRELRGQSQPKTPGAKGRLLIFLPTGEKVTVVRENVGRSYKGDNLHEVTTREGHKFCALQAQLKGFVK
jgi:hypothetical protein